MVVAIYGKNLEIQYKKDLEFVFRKLNQKHTEVIIYAPFREHLIASLGFDPVVRSVFRSPDEVKCLANIMLSLGGDGTFLESVSFVEESGIPVLGINFGRLGFLANISTNDMEDAMELLLSNKFFTQPRSLLQVNAVNNPFNSFPYGLNDFTIQKKDTTLISINTYIDEEFLCTYWADGLIISTPTGSTAYSLSVGGPIITPTTQSFVLSPIAPHNLTVRPLVIPDSSNLRLELGSRSGEVLISLDSRTSSLPSPVSFEITKAPFHIGLICLLGKSFYSTLRNKLLWGADRRNYNE